MEYAIMSRMPQPYEPVWNVLKPFSRIIWSLLAVSTFMFSLTLLLLHKESKDSFDKGSSMSFLIKGTALLLKQGERYSKSSLNL